MSIRIIIAVTIFVFASCTAAKISVPAQFKEQATRYHVKGLNGWTINQKLSFGPYQTSNIKRGWDFTSSFQFTKFNIHPEEMLLKVFDIDTDKRNLNQRNKFQYTLQEGVHVNEIYATEKFSEKQLVYKGHNSFLGNASKTKRYDYSFSAAIIPVSEKQSEPWSLVMVNHYDVEKDTSRGIFDRSYVEEEGYVTNGKENIAIRPLRIENVTTKSGRQTKVFGGKLLSGYELQWDGGVVAIIDILDNSVWMYNDLEPSEKLLVSSIASAIMLKRMQDIEKDKEELED